MSPPEETTTKQPKVEEPPAPRLDDVLDMRTFDQILEMDEPDDNEFSSSIVFGFFDQAQDTFKDMDAALKEKDLEQLSSLGHFLKGSSATIGLWKVRDSCEKIQRYGKKEKIDGSPEDDEDVCLKEIESAISTVKTDIAEADTVLSAYYGKEKEEDDA